MHRPWQYNVPGGRDLRIDWLRGLAMTCVIVDHSGLASLLSWFSYQRFWVVTAAEVFVVLSGVVLGMVYGRRLERGDWRGAIWGLTRRTATLYGAFVAVAFSVLAFAALDVDVRSVTLGGDGHLKGASCFLAPPALSVANLSDIALLRCGPWPFAIGGLYVWLVAAAVPCLVALRAGGWRPLLAASWCLYLVYQLAPHSLTAGAFEEAFPLLAWQLLFVHGLAIGYHRDRISACAARCPRLVPIALAGATAAFAVFALCNPWNDGPRALRWQVVSSDRFASLYHRYFMISELGVGRILNLTVALPVGYALLTRSWGIVRPLGMVFVTLGQQSLGAFVLHVYGLILLAHLPVADAFWVGTVVQIALLAATAGLLRLAQSMRDRARRRRRRDASDPAAELAHSRAA